MSWLSLWTVIAGNFGTFLTVFAGLIGTVLTSIIAISSGRKKNRLDIQNVINESFKTLTEKLNQRIAEQDVDIAKYRSEIQALLRRIETMQRQCDTHENRIDVLTDFIRNKGFRPPDAHSGSRGEEHDVGSSDRFPD